VFDFADQFPIDGWPAGFGSCVRGRAAATAAIIKDVLLPGRMRAILVSMHYSTAWSLLGIVVVSACLGLGCDASGGSNNPFGGYGRGGSSGGDQPDASDGGSSGEGGGSTDGSGGGAAASGGGAAAGAGGHGGKDAALDVDFAYDAPTHDTALTQDSACVSATAEAKPVPLDIYLMQDSTGSMGMGSGKWEHCVTAINGFVVSSTQQGNRLALKFFDSDITDSCNGSYYANPDVPLTALPVPAGSNDISTALQTHSPGGGTPTEGALRGIAQFTSSHKSPGRAMIGIIVTDGDPSSCNTDIGDLTVIIQQHFQSTQIMIFVVGMNGAIFGNLEQWAIAGGGQSHADHCETTIQPCHFYNIADGNPAAFIDALNSISQKAIACTYQMPTSDAGAIDSEKVSIEYTPGGQTTPQKLTNVGTASQCGPGGWYYDKPTDPTTITLCPDTCTAVQADSGAKIQILLGCLVG
jgi:hypothetical protein